jgi:hypothetical protein
MIVGIILLAAGIFFARFTLAGVRSGRLQSRSGTVVQRAREKDRFWLHVWFYGVAAFVCLACGILQIGRAIS